MTIPLSNGGPPSPRSTPMQRGTLESAKKSKPFQPFAFVWRRAPLILGIGIPAFLLLSTLLLPFATPVYNVEGVLLINPTKEPTVTGRERDVIQGDIGVFQRTLVLRILDPEILRAALEALPDKNRPSFLVGQGASDRAVFTLMGRLKPKEVERTYLIQVTLSGSESAGLAETLKAVLSSLMDKLKREQERQYEARLSYLRDEHEKIAARTQEEKNHVLALAHTLDNQTFLREAYTADLSKLEVIQKLYWEAEADLLGKQSQLRQAKLDRDQLSKVSLSPFAEERVADNFGINQIERWTYEKSQELRSNIDGLTKANPDRQYVEARMIAMNQYMDAYKKTVGTATINNLTQKRAFELETAEIKARSASDAAQDSTDLLRQKLDQANQEAGKVSEAIFEASERTYTISQLRERLASISSRIDDAELEAKSPLPVSIDQVPATPVKPTSSNASKLRLLALVVSFGFVGAGCLLFDFFDGRVRNRAELGAAVGGAGSEPIPATQPEGEDPAFAEVLRQQPGHAATLALRDLALRLVLEKERSGARIFSFTGAHHRSGNSAIALNVARAVSAQGYRVLLAELPTATPGLAALAGLSADAPPASVWGNKSPDAVGGVELIPWNPAVPEDRARASLGTFLEQAAKAYDLVLLDLVPLATSALSHEAALKSDVVVVSARQDVGLYRDARRTVEWVAAGGVPAITAVLNFATPDALPSRLFQLLAEGQRRISALHRVVEKRAAAVTRKQTEKLTTRWRTRK